MGAVLQRWTSARARDTAVAVVRTLRGAGHTAYFAGGCVRDELLGLDPVDYDVATDAKPDRIQSLFRRTAAVGASFGVVLVKERDVTVEVATFRSDGPYSDKRRPDSVEFADAEHDARRRDFTINALFLDPLASADAPDIRGHTIDYVGGLADLQRRLIRAVGDPDQRLAEDHLRALRAVRFAARYGFAIESGTASAIRQHAGELAGVSRERIGDELRRMLAGGRRGQAVELLEGLGLDAVVLGGGGGAEREQALGRLGEVSFGGALACWALDRGEVESAAQIPGLVARWRAALCLSNEESDALRDSLRGVLDLERAWGGLAMAAKKRMAASAWFGDALAVVCARDQALGEGLGREVAALAGDRAGLAPPPLIDGHDLLASGAKPGPVFARVLAAVYDAQLEGRVEDKAAALRMATELCMSGGV
jgi:hypothetical protein